jgi:transposase InsO family protein
MKVSESGFYAWRSRRGEADRRIPDDEPELRRAIKRFHRKSRGRYGRPRLLIELQREGFHVGGNRVRRIMREMGIEGRSGRKRKRRKPQAQVPPAPNLLERNFDIQEPNTVWAGDICELRVGQARLFFAVVVDLCSRMAVGWALDTSATTALVTAAMKRAVRRRKPPRGLIFHSDQGTQYASRRFRTQLRTLGVRQSMSRRANCWDNSPIESFFGTVKKELVYTRSWVSRTELERALNRYIRDFYNRHRIHSTLGYVSPTDYELQNKAA